MANREARRGAEQSAWRSAPLGVTIMITERKIICAKVGLLELARQLGNVSQAMMGIGVLSSQGPIEPIVWDSDDALVAR